MQEIKTIGLILFGGAAAFFILWLAGRVARIVFNMRFWPLRMVWPYFIREAIKFLKHSAKKARHWNFLGSVAVLVSIGSLWVTYKFAGLWPSHNWHGYEISWLGLQTYFVFCDHGYHNAALWITRAVVVITALNFYTKLFMSWEDCRREILDGFAANKFFESGQAKIEAPTPHTYLLKTRAPVHIKKVFDQLDAIQRAAGVMLIGVGNAPPSGIMIIASKKGLPKIICGLVICRAHCRAWSRALDFHRFRFGGIGERNATPELPEIPAMESLTSLAHFAHKRI